MNSKYSPKNLIVFKINDIEYVLPKYITEKMLIFSSTGDLGGEINIQYSISDDIVEKIFNIISGFNDISKKTPTERLNPGPIGDAIEIISFMRYLCVESKIIENVIFELIKENPIDLIDVFLNNTYHPEMNFIYECISGRSSFIFSTYDRPSEVNKIILKIRDNLPMELNLIIVTCLLKKLIYGKEYDVIFATDWRFTTSKDTLKKLIDDNYQYIKRDTTTLPSINKVYKLFGFQITSHCIHHEKLSVTKFLVNNREIKICGVTTVATDGAYGTNLADTIAMHISKLLLDLDNL